jgi:hypothetical protein
VELQQIQPHMFQDRVDLFRFGIDKQTDHTDKRRNARNNLCRRFEIDVAGTGRVENETDGIATSGDCCPGIFDSGNPTDFDSGSQ